MLDLSVSWDENVAKDLFWERLHHQDDLYPVTFAALPWLWKMYEQKSKPDSETLIFLAHVLGCSSFPTRTGDQYQGLSLQIENHRHGFIPSQQHLLDEDMVTLASLEDWFTKVAPAIAEVCLEAIPHDDVRAASLLSSAFAGMKKSAAVVYLMQMWENGEALDIMRAQVSLTSHDTDVLHELVERLMANNSRLAQFLLQFSALNSDDLKMKDAYS